MDWASDLDVKTKKLIPRLGRRKEGNTQEEKSDDDLLESTESLSSAKPANHQKGPAPAVPPRARKTGWGDELKSAKPRGASALEDKFSISVRTSKEDDIPVIPDLDEIIEDTGALDISKIPSIGTNQADTEAYKELDKDLTKHKLATMLEGVDLSMLVDKLYPEELVQEPDEVWTWDSLFAQVAAEINAEEAAEKNNDKSQ